MNGREFLELARELSAGTKERHWRAACVHAYYALMLEGRDAQYRWGFALPTHQSVHSVVRLRFVYSLDADLKTIGNALEDLAKLRNRASYDFGIIIAFTSNSQGMKVIQRVTDMLALLDQFDQDPVRRATATASIRP